MTLFLSVFVVICTCIYDFFSFQQADRYGGDSSRRSKPPAVPSTNGHSLLEGEYNEDDSAASFQKALIAWRQGDSMPKAEADGKSVTSPGRGKECKNERKKTG